VREELKADLYGAAAAPGVVEGVARVIMGADKLSREKFWLPRVPPQHGQSPLVSLKGSSPMVGAR